MGNKENLTYASVLPEKKKRKVERKDPVQKASAPEGERRKRKRVGRGRAAGQGKTCGRGQKGQKSRSGYSRTPGFEGGQMPLHRRLPKRGFTNIFKRTFQVVNLAYLAGITGELNPERMEKLKLISDAKKPVKILGTGEIKEVLKVEADAFSKGAKAKIEAAGGSVSLRTKSEGKTKNKDES